MEEADHDHLNVLVIDDDRDMRKLLVDIITRRKHQAVPVPSAEEGLNLLPYWTFQVAFVDYHLPGMDGLVLGEYLHKNNPDMTIALVTGQGDQRVERKSYALSMKYISKPFKVGEIVQVMEDYLNAAAERATRRLNLDDPDFGPALGHYFEDLADCYGIPNVPNRIEQRLVETLKRSLNNLRATSRYTERDRAVALAGLITAKVLNLPLPKASSGRTLYQEYDVLMHQHGRRAEFEK